ncbi:HD-GYP domain-containing protein [Christensenella intestinihominis]|uniref:HD-GYP domain-containing protein n=1 Tax=Christensenella intestinihominis TaxID=1851429 RepID=UPI00156187A3|nr:HD domain-containing phosphohydrolase [Christensenella intestinihominis]
MNSIDSRLVDHGSRVAYMVYRMMRESGEYDEEYEKEIVFITLLHDIGAYKTEEIDRMMEFESANIWDHSIYGYLFLKHLTPFAKTAPAVLFHHTNYCDLVNIDADIQHKKVAQLIHIADRADTYIFAERNRFDIDVLRREEGLRFSGEALGLFHRAQEKENMINKITDGSYKGEFRELLRQSEFSPDKVYTLLTTAMFAIDFRSVHTVTHTITTMEISDEIAKQLGITGEEADKLHLGALLHDMGKIAIPIEILENPDRLSPEEMAVMRTHVDITEKIIGNSIDREIKENAIRHHEKMDGSGYPRGLTAQELTTAQKIVGVADIISALRGTRSYKKAYPKEKILSILNDMLKKQKLDSQIVETVRKRFDSIMQCVDQKCAPIIQLYQTIISKHQPGIYGAFRAAVGARKTVKRAKGPKTNYSQNTSFANSYCNKQPEVL